MENKIISIDICPGMDDEVNENAGVMWEHNATSIVFNIDSAYVDDYRYYIEYRSLIGTKVRTEYLELNTATNTITYDIPVTMTSLRGVECYFNIVTIDEDGQTVQVIKPRKFCLQFEYAPDTDNELAKANDFSINALLEAIRLGTFQGGSGGGVVVDSKMSDVSSNPIQNKIVKVYIDKIAENAVKLMDKKDQDAVNSVVKYLEENYISKEDEIANVKISSITENTQDGGSNIVTFSDGKTLTVKNGSKGSKGDKGDKGDMPIKGTDYFTEDDKEEIKSEGIALISQELAKRGQIRPEFANNISECADTTKLYVLPDNFIYAYMYAESDPPAIIVEKKSGGYWQYFSDRNIIQFNETDDYYTSRTNKIEVTPGDSFSYTNGYNDKYVPAVVWYDDNKTIVSTEYGKEEYTVPTGVAFAEFYAYNKDENKSIVSVSWINCQAVTTGYQWKNTGHAFVPADYEAVITELSQKVAELENKTTESVLKNKKIVYDGDSICYGAGYRGGYAGLIADKIVGYYENQGIGGGKLITRTDGGHSVVDNLENLPTNGDLYCFQGGVNDHWGNTVLGEITSDYTEALDKTTFCGALEYVFRYALTNFNAPICFIITHRCKNQGTNDNGNTYAQFREKMIGICEKYAIPYYDAFAESGLNSWNSNHLSKYFQEGDGCHPNEEGYKRYYVPQLISLFEKIMPGN